MTLRSVNFDEPTNYFYFYQQLKALIYIVIAILVLWKFPVRTLKNHKFASIAMILAFVLQCLVFTKW
jgi:cell division protein FtsW (lipid II flippase)